MNENQPYHHQSASENFMTATRHYEGITETMKYGLIVAMLLLRPPPPYTKVTGQMLENPCFKSSMVDKCDRVWFDVVVAPNTALHQSDLTNASLPF